MMTRLTHLGLARLQALTDFVRAPSSGMIPTPQLHDRRFEGVAIEFDASLEGDLSSSLADTVARCAELDLSAKAVIASDRHLGICQRDPTLHARAIEVLSAAIHTASQAGIEGFIITPTGRSTTADGRSWSYQDSLNALAGSLRRVTALLCRSGVRLAIAVRQHEFLMSPPEARELFDSLCCPWIGACIGVGQGLPPALACDWITTLGRHNFAVVFDPSTADSTSQTAPEKVVVTALENINSAAILIYPAVSEDSNQAGPPDSIIEQR